MVLTGPTAQRWIDQEETGGNRCAGWCHLSTLFTSGTDSARSRATDTEFEGRATPPTRSRMVGQRNVALISPVDAVDPRHACRASHATHACPQSTFDARAPTDDHGCYGHRARCIHFTPAKYHNRGDWRISSWVGGVTRAAFIGVPAANSLSRSRSSSWHRNQDKRHRNSHQRSHCGNGCGAALAHWPLPLAKHVAVSRPAHERRLAARCCCWQLAGGLGTDRYLAIDVGSFL